MATHQGHETGKFGCHLAEQIEASPAHADWQVFYDHGDPKRQPNVAAIKGFFGTAMTNANRLADIDVLVASPDDVVQLLIEIEERPSPPKKLLGDVLAIMLCNHLAVKTGGVQKQFEISSATCLIVAGIISPKGHTDEKITEVIGPRIGQLKGLAGGLSPANVSFIFTPEIEETIEALWVEVATVVGLSPT